MLQIEFIKLHANIFKLPYLKYYLIIYLPAISQYAFPIPNTFFPPGVPCKQT